MIFLKLAENTLGEYDMTIWPLVIDTSTPKYWVNQTEIEERVSGLPGVAGTSARWILVSNVINSKNHQKNGTGVILGIDSAHEQGLIGREWTHKPLVGNSAHISSSLLRLLGVNPNKGETVTLEFDFIGLATTLNSGLSESELVESLVSQLRKFVKQSSPNVDSLTFDVDQIIKYLKSWGVALPPQINNILPVLKNPVIQQQMSAIFLGWLKSVGIPRDVLLGSTSKISEAQLQAIKSVLSISFDLIVEDDISKPYGKFPESLGNVVVVELDYLNSFAKQLMFGYLQRFQKSLAEMGPLANLISQAQLDDFKLQIAKFDTREFSMLTLVTYSDRLNAFVQSREKMDEKLTQWSNKIGERLGMNYPALLQVPLVKTLQVLYYLRLFLDQLLTVIELFLMFVGMYLIYALLIADVESKVYEMGMLRALGMEKYTLVEIVVFESLFFSVPGISLGLLLAFATFQPVASLLAWYTSMPVSFGLDPVAIAMGTALGSLMPLISIIEPIKRALSKTLRDALDLYHSLTNDTKVTFTYLQNLGISTEQTSLSILCVLIGFLIYYLVPYSFVFLYLGIFFNIFVAIIMGMIFGLALLGMIFHPFVEKAFIHLLIWGPDRRCLKPVVIKNLSGHSRRNSKTAIMYTICMAFLIFSGTVFRHQVHTLIAGIEVNAGADIVIQSFAHVVPLNWEPMRDWLRQEIQRPGTFIKGYCFVTWPINDFAYVADNIRISTLTDWPSHTVFLMGVEYNFLDITFDQFIGITELNTKFPYNKTKNGQPDIIKSLYDKPSKGIIKHPPMILSEYKEYPIYDHDPEIYSDPLDIIIGESSRTVLSVDVNSMVDIQIPVAESLWDNRKAWRTHHHLAQVRAMVKKFPGFIFSSYPPTAIAKPAVLISIDQYERLMKQNYNLSYARDNGEYPNEAARRALFIKVAEEATLIQREEIVNSLRTWIRDSRVVITDIKFLRESMDVAVYVLDLFNNIVAATIIVLCFFMLFISFTANITENAWEFGVLRALGMTAQQVIRVYIYEALALVFASVFLGFVIGNLVSVTLTAESNLFTELPFTFEFPLSLFGTVTLLSMTVAILGSYIPARVLLNKRIASALKNV